MSANQVKSSVAELVEALKGRMDTKFLPKSVQNEMAFLKNQGHVITKDNILKTTSNFYSEFQKQPHLYTKIDMFLSN